MFEPIKNYADLKTLNDFSIFLQTHCGFCVKKPLTAIHQNLGWLENDRTHIQLLRTTSGEEAFWICVILNEKNKFVDFTSPQWHTFPQYFTGMVKDVADSVIDKENRILIFPNSRIAWNY